MATAHKSRVLDMTQGDPFRLVLQFSMPLFCSNLLQQLYNLTDTALAGHLLGAAALAQLARARAVLRERDYVVPDDVREIFEDVCAHRLVMKPQAKIEGITAHDVLSQVLKEVPGPAFGRKQK